MNRNKRRRTPVLPMLMLLAALGMGTAGCSQSDYLLPTEQQQGIPTARGDEPLLLSIGAKPGFEGGSTRAFAGVNTRATVDDASGDWKWVAKDIVYVKMTFTEADGTTMVGKPYFFSLKYDGTTNNGLIPGWVAEGIKTHDDYGVPYHTWPEGAAKCQLQAFASSDATTLAADPSNNIIHIKLPMPVLYDCMTCKQEFNVGDALTIALKHANTRLTFKGLAASTVHGIKTGSADFKTVKSTFDLKNFEWITATETRTITTDGSGNMTYCLSLDDKLDTNGKVTIEVTTNAGATTVGTIELQGTKTGVDGSNNPVYSLAGKRFNISVVANGGGVHPGNDPDLLP